MGGLRRLVIRLAFLRGEAEPGALLDGFEQRGIDLGLVAGGDKKQPGAHGDKLYRSGAFHDVEFPDDCPVEII